MSRGFTSTSVLESSDGIDFSVEKRKDNEETRLAKLRSAQAEAKPLFEQLAEQQQKKQEEYDAMTKLIFAPPKALDDEDVEYFDELSKRKAEMDAKISVQEEEMLAAYRAARSSAPAAEAPTTLLSHKPKPQQKKPSNSGPKPATIVIKSKRKDQPSLNTAATDGAGAAPAKKQKNEETAPAAPDTSDTNPLAGLSSAYAESSEDEES